MRSFVFSFSFLNQLRYQLLFRLGARVCNPQHFSLQQGFWRFSRACCANALRLTEPRSVRGYSDLPLSRILASNSSRCVVSPVPQLPLDSSGLAKTACAPFMAARGELIAALASARWPLPIDTPLKARVANSGLDGYGFGLEPKLYLKFFQLSPLL